MDNSAVNDLENMLRDDEGSNGDAVMDYENSDIQSRHDIATNVIGNNGIRSSGNFNPTSQHQPQTFNPHSTLTGSYQGGNHHYGNGSGASVNGVGMAAQQNYQTSAIQPYNNNIDNSNGNYQTPTTMTSLAFHQQQQQQQQQMQSQPLVHLIQNSQCVIQTLQHQVKVNQAFMREMSNVPRMMSAVHAQTGTIAENVLNVSEQVETIKANVDEMSRVSTDLKGDVEFIRQWIETNQQQQQQLPPRESVDDEIESSTSLDTKHRYDKPPMSLPALKENRLVDRYATLLSLIVYPFGLYGTSAVDGKYLVSAHLIHRFLSTHAENGREVMRILGGEEGIRSMLTNAGATFLKTARGLDLKVMKFYFYLRGILMGVFDSKPFLDPKKNDDGIIVPFDLKRTLTKIHFAFFEFPEEPIFFHRLPREVHRVFGLDNEFDKILVNKSKPVEKQVTFTKFQMDMDTFRKCCDALLETAKAQKSELPVGFVKNSIEMVNSVFFPESDQESENNENSSNDDGVNMDTDDRTENGTDRTPMTTVSNGDRDGGDDDSEKVNLKKPKTRKEKRVSVSERENVSDDNIAENTNPNERRRKKTRSSPENTSVTNNDDDGSDDTSSVHHMNEQQIQQHPKDVLSSDVVETVPGTNETVDADTRSPRTLPRKRPLPKKQLGLVGVVGGGNGTSKVLSSTATETDTTDTSTTKRVKKSHPTNDVTDEHHDTTASEDGDGTNIGGDEDSLESGENLSVKTDVGAKSSRRGRLPLRK